MTKTSFFLFSVFWLLGSFAQASYLGRPEVDAFISDMVSKHQFDQKNLQQLFSQTQRKPKILEAIARPAEKRLNWARYRKIFLTRERISQGKQFVSENRETLLQAQEKFGVSPYIVAAIIGVETRYGKHKGSYRVMDALATLAFDYPPRSTFFKSELEQALLLSREQGFDPLTLKGSYAGAMGYGQFIPSSYRNFAIDFDGDKVADILNNRKDAIGSVANYFKRHGWTRNAPVAEPAVVTGSAYKQVLNKKLKPRYTVKDMLDKGVSFKNQRATALLADDAAAKLMPLDGPEGKEFWLGFHNFYVITRYNHSHLYAMAVYQLAEAIASE